MGRLQTIGVVLASMVMLTGVSPVVSGPAAAATGGGSAGERACVAVVDAGPAGATGGHDTGADGIVAGPGGAWFGRAGSVNRVAAGHVDSFPVPDAISAHVGDLVATSGAVWFADTGNARIGTVDARGRVTVYPIPATAAGPAMPTALVVDGRGTDVWFTDVTANSISRLDPRSGRVASTPIPTAGSGPTGLTRGADGALWFAERTAGRIGRLSAAGSIREWPLAAGAAPADLTVGPDNAIWFTEPGLDRVGRIDRGGSPAEYPLAGGPTGIAAGPGGNLYVSLSGAGALVRLDASGRETLRWHLSGANGPRRVAAVDGDIWTTDPVNDIVYRVRPTCTQPWVDADVAARAQAILDANLPTDGPGCSVAFGQDGNVVWTGVRGLADVPRAIPITPRTIFDAGSVAKQFTAAAVLLLAQRHRLALTDTLADHLDGFPAWAGTVTLDQMIHHTSGIPDFYGIFDAQGYWRTDHVTQQMIVDALRAAPALDFAPGSQWAYSNSNYVLLAEIVARVSGVDFPTYLKRTIFDPLHLDMVVDAIDPIPGRAVNYDTDTGVLRANDNERWEPIGEGALQTTPSELVRWADNYRVPRVGGPQLLAAQLDHPVQIVPGGPTYGAGLFIGADGRLGHGGSWLGFEASFQVSADRHRSAVVSCNSWGIDIDDIAGQLNALYVNPTV